MREVIRKSGPAYVSAPILDESSAARVLLVTVISSNADVGVSRSKSFISNARRPHRSRRGGDPVIFKVKPFDAELMSKE